MPGLRTFNVNFNVWRVLGNTGEVRGEAGMPNGTFKKPIGEHIKNLMRGRQAWGCKHVLTDKWAQLPAGKMELTGADVYARPERKRSRATAPERPLKRPCFEGA